MTRRMDIRVLLAKYENWLDDVITSFMFVLHDKEGFGEMRIKRVYQEWGELWDSLQGEYLSCEDLKKTLKEECNFESKKMKNGKGENQK